MILGNGLGLRVGHVNEALLDNNPAGPAELLPLLHVVSVLVENLNAVVVAISHEQAALRVESQAVRQVELARASSLLAPGLDEFSVFREFHDAVVGIAAMTIGNKNIAVGSDGHGGRHVEGVGTISSNARLPQSHQHFSIGTEFENLVAFSFG